MKQWLPKGYDFTNATVAINANGAWTNLEASGKFELKAFKTPWARPLDAAGKWKSEGLQVGSLELALRAGQTALDLRATLDAAGERRQIQVAGLTLSKSGKPLLDLEKPFKISVDEIARKPASFSRAKIQPLHWLGTGGDLRLESELGWPEYGRAHGSVTGVELQVLDDLFSWATNQATIGQLEFAGGWSNGPVVLHGNLQAQLQRRLPLSARADLSLDAEGIHIKSLTVTNENQLVGGAEGLIPITLHPGSQKGFVQADSKAPLRLKVSAEPRAFSEYVRGAGMVVERPDLQVRLEGTLDAPNGQVDLAAAGLQFARTNRQLPQVEDFHLHATVNRQIARLTDVQFTVAKQPVKASAEIPLGNNFWSSLTNKALVPDWKTARAQIQIAHAHLAPFAPLLPKVMSPEGELDMDVSLLPGGKLDGYVTVSHGRTYPIESLGSLREILLRLRFQGQKMLVEAAADLGGQPVPITGSADFSGGEWLHGELPPFELKVGGAGVPLSRSPELILKADLDLKIVHDTNQPVTIGGSLNLRDGYYLRDISLLTPGKTAAPSQRPPYFSIVDEPMAGWRLKLNVTGSRFLKVRSPLFNGQISTIMHLQGPLKEPIAIGDVKIDSGDVRFPFATLPVTQGLITLTSENPYHPQVAITAGARTFGYDIKMEIKGSADAPVIQFSSTPPLSSEQILLMVSAGELPRGELNFSSVQKAQRLALFIGKDLLSELGFAGDANRLTIRSGEDISEAGKPTYSVEYKLTEDWSVIGEYDRFNDFNLMLKWRLYSK